MIEPVNIFRARIHADYESPGGIFMGNFGFRDQASRFSILKSNETLPGPDQCFIHADIDARPIFEKLLGLRITYLPLADDSDAQGVSTGQTSNAACSHGCLSRAREGNKARLRTAVATSSSQQRSVLRNDSGQPNPDADANSYSAINYYPSRIEETFYHNGLRPLPPVEGQCLMFYPETDRLTVVYVLSNRSNTNVPLKLQWYSQPESGSLSAKQPMENGFLCKHEQTVTKAYAVTTRLLSGDEQALRFTFSEGSGQFQSEECTCRLGPMETKRFQFEILLSLNDEMELEKVVSSGLRKIGVETVRSDWARFFAELPTLPQGSEQHHRVVMKAVCALRSLRHHMQDADGKSHLTIQTCKCGVGGSWFWDTAFTLQAYGLMHDPDPAFAAARLLINGITDDGVQPGCFAHGGYRYFYQQPILCWGILQFLRFCPNVPFLKEAYEPLCRYVNHWFSNWQDTTSGLCVYPPGGTCWDDALRWQTGLPLTFSQDRPWYEHDWGEMRPELFVNVDTNTYLLMECQCLAEFADLIGKGADAAEWRAKADNLSQNIETYLYNHQEGVFMDRQIDGGVSTDMLTPSSFMPLFAGVGSANIAESMCRNYLLNPDHFYTQFPFPTLDRSHCIFRSGGTVAEVASHPGSMVQQSYWIGRSWPHISHWMVGALWQSGLKSEADEAANKILNVIDNSERIYECYDSLTGYGNGHPDYSWSAAAVLALAYRLYRHSPTTLSINS